MKKEMNNAQRIRTRNMEKAYKERERSVNGTKRSLNGM